MGDLIVLEGSGFQRIEAAGHCVMTKARRRARLRLIRRLTAEEISGWLKARRYDDGSWFPGEMVALRERARELGVRL